MALIRLEKEQAVADLQTLLGASKLTVVVNYHGATVKQLQELRIEAKTSNTTIKIAKNRLVKQAINGTDQLKGTDTGALTSQLLYAFNDMDEVSPAKVIASFKKKTGKMEFVGAITADGEFIDAESVRILSELPGVEQLRSQLVSTIAAPLSGSVS